MHRLILGVFLCSLLGGAAHAASISVSVASDNGQCFVNNAATSNCVQDNDVFGSDIGIGWSASATPSAPLTGIGSTSAAFSIDALAAADGGPDTRARAHVDYDLILGVTVDSPNSTWTVDLSQSALGLFGLRGDGTASQVGNQDDGSASISTISTLVDGSPVPFTPSPSSYSADVGATQQKSQQFSGNRFDGTILSGTGSQTFAVSISFDLEAFSNDGCSGFICSSISGGEEAAALFGMEGLTDQAMDDYSTWGRAKGPDGYNSTWTLNVTFVPEPMTAVLLAGGLLGLGAAARRRRNRA